jgi:hypothetical protein
MIVGFVVTCDVCGETGAVSLSDKTMKSSISGDILSVIDRWVCDECIAKDEEKARETA